MGEKSITVTKAAATRQAVPDTQKLGAKYGCGPVHFSGTDEVLYERHLLFDSGVDLAAATARDRFEALARSGPMVAAPGNSIRAPALAGGGQFPERVYLCGRHFIGGAPCGRGLCPASRHQPATERGGVGERDQVCCAG